MPATLTQRKITDGGPFRASRAVLVVGILVLVAVAATVAVSYAADEDQRDLAGVRAAVAPYHDMDRAMADGWERVDGLDHCFEDEELGGMGYPPHRRLAPGHQPRPAPA